jgi:hypothetical protein
MFKGSPDHGWYEPLDASKMDDVAIVILIAD